MDPLQELYNLFEAEVSANQKRSEPTQHLHDPTPMLGTPAGEPNGELHPETQRKRKVDDEVKAGKVPSQAHQSAFGEVDTHSVESKAQLAKTLGRFSNENNKGHIAPDPNSGSIYSQFTKTELDDPVSPEDLKTPMNQEEVVPEGLDIVEEIDYNEDLDYLRVYGRA